MLRRLGLFVLAILAAFIWGASPGPSPASAQANCQFLFGFKALHDQIPAVVGPCLGDETHNPDNGDGLQQTLVGLLVWRKADNWTAFTNGAITWLNGPCGLQTRPNQGPFYAWEGRPGADCSGRGSASPAPALATAPPSSAAAAPHPPALSGGFDPTGYVGQWGAYNYTNFTSQRDVQAVLRADPSDPNRLDADRDGVACESHPAPRDTVPVTR